MSYPKNRVGYVDNTLKRKAKAPEASPKRCSQGFLLQGHYPKALLGVSRSFCAILRTIGLERIKSMEVAGASAEYTCSNRHFRSHHLSSHVAAFPVETRSKASSGRLRRRRSKHCDFLHV